MMLMIFGSKKNKQGIKMAKEKVSEKERVLNDTIEKLEKEYGKGTLMFMGDAPIVDIPVISTGCLSIDNALGVGGIPRGRITEVYGPEASGKTTLCLHMIAEAQKAGGIAAFIDAEHALDTKYAANIGVNIPKLLMSQPDFGEQALEIVDSLVRSGTLDIIVVDSVAALVPRSEIEGDMGDATMAVQARLMSQALRKLTAVVAKSQTSLVFINQLRSKIGVMFGNPETTTGGNALKFYSSVRIDVRRMASIKSGEDVVGNRTKVKIVKNKVSTPFKQVEIDIINPYGFDIVGDLVDCGVSAGVIKKGGAWFTIGEDRFQGRDNVKTFLRSDPVFYTQMKEQISAALKNSKPVEKAPEVLPNLV